MSLRPPARPAWSMRSRPWREVEFASLDFETTGLDRERDAVVSFGVVPVREGRVVVGEAVHQLVLPAVPSSAESMRIHGILPKDLAHAQPLSVAGQTLRLALGGRSQRHLITSTSVTTPSIRRSIAPLGTRSTICSANAIAIAATPSRRLSRRRS